MADAKTQIVPIEPTREMLSRMEGMTDFVLPEGLENTKQARMAEMRFAWGEALSAAPQPAASDVPHDVVEQAARASYEYEGDRKGIDYAGWDLEPENVKRQWRASVTVPISIALATPAPSTSTATPDLDAWAYAFANWRQGQRSTPSCEAPGAADIRTCRDLIKGMLACRPSAPSTSTEEALRQATSLATALFNLHYRFDEDYASGRVKWKPLSDLCGVIGQIDNMTTGLVRAPSEEALRAENARLKQALSAIAHTFVEDSHGGMKDMPSSWHREQARTALSALSR